MLSNGLYHIGPRYQDKHGCTEDYYTLTISMPSVLYQDKHGCTKDYYT